MRGLVVVFALVAGCQLTSQAQVDDVATELCHCFAPADTTCPTELENALGSSVSDACVQCVFDDQRTCAAMLDDCTPLCFQTGITP